MSIFEYNEEEELKKLRASEFRGAYKEAYNKAYNKAYKEAYAVAVLQERIEYIFELLQEYGEIPDDLKQKISSQKDKEILTKWRKLAARVHSIDEFAEKIGTDAMLPPLNSKI